MPPISLASEKIAQVEAQKKDIRAEILADQKNIVYTGLPSLKSRAQKYISWAAGEAKEAFPIQLFDAPR